MLRRGMSFDPIKWSEDEASASQLAEVLPLAHRDASPKDPTSLGEGQTVERVAPPRSRIAAALKIGSAV